MPNNPMLTRPIHNHPWTRVSWISGSDIDDLDEEEVQEVESITLGRAFASNDNQNGAATAASSVMVAPTTDEDEVKTQKVSNSVTLKPFSFESTQEDSENSSVLAPFAFPNNLNNSSSSNSAGSSVLVNHSNSSSVVMAAANTNSSPYGVAPTTTTTQKDVLVSQKGHLITPAVQDAVLEEEEEAPPKKRSSWKSFWQGSKEEEPVKTPDQTWGDDGVVEEEEQDEGDAEVGIRARWTEKAKGCFLWVVDGLLRLWTKWVAFGILMNTWLKNGITVAKGRAKEWTIKATELPKVVTTVGPAAGPVAWGLGLGLVALMCLLPVKRTPSPANDLREFVRFEKANNVVNLQVIDELNTEAFRTYARSTCVEAATMEQARNALDVGLFGVPEAVRSTVVQMAILEGVTQKNSIQDSNSDFVESGKADAFMAYWSTLYDPNDQREAYKSCVMVTGVALTVAETVAEWTTKREKYQIGTEPCHCGYVYCEECPVFDVREVSWPIFERRSLSLKKQQELRHWMIDQAVKSAEHLVLDGSDKLILGSGSAVAKSPFSWTGQTSSAFFGEDSHRDRAASSSSSVGATAQPEL